eukprot:2518146-Rhodomonas_salina.1
MSYICSKSLLCARNQCVTPTAAARALCPGSDPTGRPFWRQAEKALTPKDVLRGNRSPRCTCPLRGQKGTSACGT